MSAEISSQDSQRDALGLLCDSLVVSSLIQQVGGQIHGFFSAQDSGNLFLTSHEDYRFNREKMDF